MRGVFDDCAARRVDERLPVRAGTEPDDGRALSVVRGASIGRELAEAVACVASSGVTGTRPGRDAV